MLAWQDLLLRIKQSPDHENFVSQAEQFGIHPVDHGESLKNLKPGSDRSDLCLEKSLSRGETGCWGG